MPCWIDVHTQNPISRIVNVACTWYSATSQAKRRLLIKVKRRSILIKMFRKKLLSLTSFLSHLQSAMRWKNHWNSLPSQPKRRHYLMCQNLLFCINETARGQFKILKANVRSSSSSISPFHTFGHSIISIICMPVTMSTGFRHQWALREWKHCYQNVKPFHYKYNPPDFSRRATTERATNQTTLVNYSFWPNTTSEIHIICTEPT